jgi:hypothetical protein
MRSKAFRTLFDDFEPVKIRTEPNRTEPESSKNRTGTGSVPRWQKPNRTESLQGVDKTIMNLFLYEQIIIKKLIN